MLLFLLLLPYKDPGTYTKKPSLTSVVHKQTGPQEPGSAQTPVNEANVRCASDPKKNRLVGMGIALATWQLLVFLNNSLRKCEEVAGKVCGVWGGLQTPPTPLRLGRGPALTAA
jgi:hypothetical protein